MAAILVIGGAGYIGSHTCKALAEHGLTPVTFDNLGAGHRSAVRWGPLVEGELSDTPKLFQAFQRHRPQAVVHFAGHAYVGESCSEPAKYYRNNVAATLCLLDAIRQAELPGLVYSSSCATYGPPCTETIAEDHPQAPLSPYGRSKLMTEWILDDYDRAYGLRSIALRYFNAAGADPQAEIGEAHEPETHLIPLLLDAARGRRPGIEVYGQDYETPDGTCIRDYVHVSDLAEAHVMAVRSLLEGAPTGRINLGNGQGHSVLQVIRAAEEVTGRRVELRMCPRRPGDAPRMVADASLAKSQLGWIPLRAELETQVEDAWRWHLKHHA